ncbi:MAG: DNA-binding response regulator, partial [Bacteroidota bacterium]
SKVQSVQQTFMPEAAIVPTLPREATFSNDQTDKSKVEQIFETNLPTVLVVEDNADMREYIRACLNTSYQVVLTEDGNAGVEMAIDCIPDLIVSDVMMPEQDGFSLCKTLKIDARTSHIPIILLTAKGEQEAKIKGLEVGADAYMTKPFAPKELQLRLKNLTELQQRLRDQYAEKGKEMTSNDDPRVAIKDKLLLQVYDFVIDNLDDTDLDMPRLCRAIGMSRSQIFRKVKALTGQPPSSFIRSVRLQKAKQLLQSKDLTISEIAYDVGFTSLNYFSAAFHDEFGVRPSSLRK